MKKKMTYNRRPTGYLIDEDGIIYGKGDKPVSQSDLRFSNTVYLRVPDDNETIKNTRLSINRLMYENFMAPNAKYSDPVPVSPINGREGDNRLTNLRIAHPLSDHFPGEEWKPLVIYGSAVDYQLSNYGRCYDIRNHVMVDFDNNYMVRIKSNGHSHKFKVESLVAELFIPNPDERVFVNIVNRNVPVTHLFHVGNLQWSDRDVRLRQSTKSTPVQISFTCSDCNRNSRYSGEEAIKRFRRDRREWNVPYPENKLCAKCAKKKQYREFTCRFCHSTHRLDTNAYNTYKRYKIPMDVCPACRGKVAK